VGSSERIVAARPLRLLNILSRSCCAWRAVSTVGGGGGGSGGGGGAGILGFRNPMFCS